MLVRSILASYSKLLAGVALAAVAVALAGCDAKRNGISRARVKQSTHRNARCEIKGQLLDMGFRCASDRAEDAESAIAAEIAQWDEDLIEKRIPAPASAFFGAGLEVAELGIVVPAS